MTTILRCGNLRGPNALDWALFSKSVCFMEFFFKKNVAFWVKALEYQQLK